MDYEQALHEFGIYYKDRYRVEFPLILKMCRFDGKSVLEIGSDSEGHFIKHIRSRSKSILATDISDNILERLRSRVDVKTKVCRAEKMLFPDKSFDVVFSRWAVHHIDDLDSAIKEMCRVTKDCVFIVLPSELGDETRLLSIKYKNKRKGRKKRIYSIINLMEKNGFKPVKRDRLLRFVFPTAEKATEIMSVMGFHDRLTERERGRVLRFFLRRKWSNGIHFKQGAAFICGVRR